MHPVREGIAKNGIKFSMEKIFKRMLIIFRMARDGIFTNYVKFF
jgi:hypothetical protein